MGLGDSADIAQAVKALVTHAIEERGSTDNVTAVVGRITSPSLLAATVAMQGVAGTAPAAAAAAASDASAMDRPAGMPSAKGDDLLAGLMPDPVVPVTAAAAAETPAKGGGGGVGEKNPKSPGNILQVSGRRERASERASEASNPRPPTSPPALPPAPHPPTQPPPAHTHIARSH